MRTKSRKQTHTRLITTAHHEAGHAPADYRLGFKVKRVTIVPDGEVSGSVLTNLGLKPKVLEYGNPSSVTVARWHDKIVTLLAGYVALSHS